MLYAVGLIIAFILAWKWTKENPYISDEELHQHCKNYTD